jgi:hypothetical protein
MMEAGVVIGEIHHVSGTHELLLRGVPLHWHIPPKRSSGYLPDSSNLWEVMWALRNQIDGFAHSHPGSGFPEPSHEDLTTFAAIETALGIRLEWYITSSDTLSICEWLGPEPHNYHCQLASYEPIWVEQLREISGY